MRSTIVLAISLLALPAVSSWADTQDTLPQFGEEILVLDEAPFIEPIEPGLPVFIRFGIGELDIETTGGNELRADLSVECREELSDALCEKYRSRLRLEPRRTADSFEVRLVGLSKWKLRKLRLDGKVEIPRSSPLTVKIGVGDVDIRSDSEQLTVQMGIGDLTVRVPQSSVQSVEIGTRIGDASLSGADGHLDGKRRMLLGAKLRWDEGTGNARVSVGLRIGDAKVVLE